MNYKYCIIYFLVHCLINTSTSFQLGPIPFSVRNKDLIQSQSQSCERSGWSCKDCYTLQRCGTDNLFKFQITCVDQFPDRPYCDPKTGHCVSDRHACTEMKDTEFKCPAAGIYPDVTDCRRYVSCTAENEIGLIYNCLFQSVYNAVVKRCITNSNCYNILEDCSGEYKTMPYKADPSLYVVCRGDQKPLIKDCGNRRFEYDPYLLTCDFKCKEEGRFAHSSNNSLYYICVYNNYELVRMMGLCRDGTIYNEFYDTCVYDFKLITTTEILEVTTGQIIENVTENEQAFQTTTNSYKTTTAKNYQDLDTTTENNYEDETTSNYQNYETTKVEGVTSNDDTILVSTTENIVEEITSTSTYWEESTTQNLSTTDITTSSNSLEQSTTEFTTNNVEVEIITTTPSKEATDTDNTNETNEDDTDEDTDSREQTGEVNENDTNEEETMENNTNEEETKENNTNEEESKENDTNEEIDTKEETMENNTKEDYKSSQKTEEDFESNQEDKTIEDDDTKEDSNESINKNHNCNGKKCKGKWKTRIEKILKGKFVNK